MTEPGSPASGQPGRRVTLRQVAAAAEVSTATVSYVLSGRPGRSAGISGPTIERVRETAARLGYQPNRAARATRTGRTGIVLLSLTMLSDPWSQSVIESVVPVLAAADRTALVLGDADWATALDRVEADVAFVDDTADAAAPARLQELGRRLRLVVFSDTLEPDGFDVVRSRDLPGCEIAMQHLLASHTRIGCLTSTGADGRPTLRHQVWQRAMAAAGLPHGDDLVATFRSSSASAYAAATDLLTRPDRPRAIYATTDFAAMAAVDAAQRLRIDVPGELAVIGVGNADQTALVRPSVSSVGPSGLFPALAQLLLDRARGEDRPPGLHEFDWQLFVRGSTGGPPPGTSSLA